MSLQENIVKFNTLDKNIQVLLETAVKYRESSYSPYSKFKVGACIEIEDGTLYGGCNVENGSYTVGTCAERCAYFKAISEGAKSFKRLAVIGFQENAFTTPCGACRQFISEFGDLEVYISKPDLDDVLVTSGKELLPYGFQLN